MTTIKSLDGRPIRVTKTLEDIQAPDQAELVRLREEKTRKYWNTPPEFARQIDNMIQYVERILGQREDFYKQQAYRHISFSTSNILTQVSLAYESQKNNPGVVGVVLAIFLEGVLKMIQEVEVMEGTPKEIEVCSNIGHEILHIPVREELLRTNSRVLQTLLYGSYVLWLWVDKRRKNEEDDRFVTRFIHNPEDIAPMYVDTECVYASYGNEVDPSLVTLRQMLVFAKPKNQTPYNMDMFNYMCDEVIKVFQKVVEIIKNHK